MRCILCQEAIEPHRPEVHSLKIREDRVVEICEACCRKFVAWHGEQLAKLFPTRAMKKRYGKRE